MTTDLRVQHVNENYLVGILESSADMDVIKSNGAVYVHYYAVVNRLTSVVEYKATQLPEAIMVAEQLDVAMTLRPWERMRAEAIPPAVNPDGSPLVH